MSANTKPLDWRVDYLRNGELVKFIVTACTARQAADAVRRTALVGLNIEVKKVSLQRISYKPYPEKEWK